MIGHGRDSTIHRMDINTLCCPFERARTYYLHKIILGKIGDVGMLDMRNVRGVEQSDIHILRR